MASENVEAWFKRSRTSAACEAALWRGEADVSVLALGIVLVASTTDGNFIPPGTWHPEDQSRAPQTRQDSISSFLGSIT